jgi:hypothetical protein
MFATSAPIIFGLWRIHFKAKKLGLVEKHQHNDESLSFIQKLKWIAIQVDLMGSLLLVGGLFLILLPIILATTWGGWGNGNIKLLHHFLLYVQLT